MPTILHQLDAAFRSAISAAFGVNADPLISPSANEQFGDYQSNAAMGLAKRVTESTGQKTNPRAVAEKVKAELKLGDMATDVSIAGPGFINVRLNPDWIARQVSGIAADGRAGIPAVEKPETVVVDYGGPNVAKQMHVGHLRSTIIGDAMVRVLMFQGHHVIRQNHIGDWGTQFGMLITLLQSTGGDGSGNIEDLDAFYKEARRQFDADPKVAEASRATVVRLQAGADAEMNLWRRIVEISRAHYQPLFDRLGVLLTPADEAGESFYNPMLARNVAELEASGVAVLSEGAIGVFMPGVDAPLIVKKTGGGFGYAATDLSAVRHRVQTLGASRVVYFVGAPQTQHLKQVFDAARRAGWAGSAVVEHAPFGSVLGEDGKMFKARSGESVKLADLIDEAESRALAIVSAKNPELPDDQKKAIAHAVGVGAIKYADLSKDRVGDYTFSFDSMLSLEGNTAPYLQYAHARVKSIFRRAAERGIVQTSTVIKLDAPAELTLAKHLLRLGDVIEQVARELKPHYLCTYLYELASKFSGFFENCPVLPSDDPVRSSRLTLCAATANTLACGLELLGIEHPEQM